MSTLGDDEALDRFGDTLGVGDFNGDGHDDLAVGVTWENVAGLVNVGRFVVIYGSPDKLTAVGSQSRSRVTPGIKGDPGCEGSPVMQNFWNFSAAC